MKLKKVGLISLSLGLLASICACSTITNDVKNPDNILVADNDEYANAELSNIKISTKNAKTIFYLGDEFSSDGIVVTANYSNAPSREVTKYSLDSSKIDMTATGAYSIAITYREGKEVRTAKYSIAVLSSVKETTEGTTFIGGLEVSYNASYSEDKLIKTMKLGETFDATKIKTNVTISIHKFTVGKNGALTETVESLGRKTIEIDSSQVDTSKTGTYMIKYTYTADPIVINGVSYENKGVSFTLVDVVNPVTSFTMVSGNTNIAASTDKLDLSSWKFHINREVGSGEDVYFSDDLFTVSGVCSYLPGNQTAKITLLESNTYINVPMTITESTTQDIYICNAFDKGLKYEIDESTGDKVYDKTAVTIVEETQLDDSGMIYGAYTSREPKAFNMDGLTSDIRTKVDIKTKNGYLKVNIDKPGTIILYVQSTGSDSRDCEFASEDGDIIFDVTAGGSATRNEVKITKPGSYYLTCEKTIYVWAVVIAKNKA